MCGRFTQNYTWRDIHDLYDLMGAARNLQAHYNIVPTDTVEVLKMIHAPDERVPAAAVRFGAEAVARAVERYAA